jgi:hypothetical protein
MLGRLHMSIAECKEVYIKLAKIFFSRDMGSSAAVSAAVLPLSISYKRTGDSILERLKKR